MEQMEQLDDVINPAEQATEAIELPDGLLLETVQNKAVKYNKKWDVFYSTKKTHWENNYKLFRQFDQGLVENMSTKVAEVWANIQTEIPFITNSIFTKSEIVKPIPKFLDVNHSAGKIAEYINKMILVDNKGRKESTDAIQDFLVFGSVIAKTFWDNKLTSEFDIRPVVQDAQGNIIPNPTAQQWIPKYEGKPGFYNLDIFDFAIDPSFRGHNLSEAKWVRERLYFDKEQLKELVQSEEIIKLSDAELTPSSTSFESGKDIRDRIDGQSVSKSDKCFVDEFWTELYWTDPETKQQKSDKFYFWLLNNTKIIKFKKNVFNRVPFIISRCYRLAHEFYGLGDVDVMSALSEHINVVHSQGAILAKETGQKLTLYTSSAGVDAQMLKRRSAGVLKVKDINQIRSESTTAGADLGILINYKGSLKTDLSNAVGINDVLRGESLGDQTATAISIYNSNSSARLALKLQNFQDEYIVPLAENFYNLSKQFIDTYSLILDNQQIQLSQQDFFGDYNWVPQGSVAQANRNLRIKQLTDLAIQISQGAEAAAKSMGVIKMPNFDLGEFYMNEILPMYEIQRPEQYFSPPAPMPQPGMPPAPAVQGAPNQAGAAPTSGTPTVSTSGPMPVSESLIDPTVASQANTEATAHMAS